MRINGTERLHLIAAGLARGARRRYAAFSLRTASSKLLLLTLLVQQVSMPTAAALAASTTGKPLARATSVAPGTAQTGETFTVYGPRRFDRRPGAPVSVTEQFTLPADATAPFVIECENGASNGSSRVTSASIKLNGQEVFGPSDFNQHIATLRRDVTPGATNVLEVRLASAPGSYVTIKVTATRTQSLPAGLVSVEPTRVTQGQTVSITLRGRNTHWSTGQTRASFGGEVSVGGAAPGDLGPVTVTSATTAVAELNVSPTAALAPRTARVVTTLAGSNNEEAVSLVNGLTVAAVAAPGSAAARVTTLAGVAGAAGLADGGASQARFNNLSGLAVGPDDAIYVSDAGNHCVRVVRAQPGATTYTVATLAGDGTAGYADGPANSARFNNPQGIAVDERGVVYVADTDNHRIRRIAPDGTVTTIAGDGVPGFVNGPGTQARFNSPRGVAVDVAGNVYVADTGNAAVRRINTNGEVSTLAGDGSIGATDSPNARFDGVTGVAVDGEQVYVYLADTGNHRIRRLDATNTVITIAGGERGFADGSAAQARFAEPVSLALDGAGKLIVTDSINSLVRAVDPALAVGGAAQAVTTLAGTGERGATDGAGNQARFMTPRGVAVTASSAIVVADTGNHTLRRIVLPPVIASLSPTHALAGQTINITGERFDARTPERNVVRFNRSAQAGGGQTFAQVVAATRRQLTVVVPADAASGPITVETEGGTATSPVNFELDVFPAPHIADFTPKRGASGSVVTLMGTALKAGGYDTSVTFAGDGGLRLSALVNSASETEVRATVPNGAVTGLIQLTTPGGTAATAVSFVVETPQDFTLAVAPTVATAVQRSSATYVVSLNSQQATFSQMARLSATGLPAGVEATFAPAQITAGAQATLSVNLSGANLTPGSYGFQIAAAADVEGHELVRTVAATLSVVAAGQTTLSGRVLSTSDEPIMGATVSLDGVTATTDAAGAFILVGVTAGPARPLMIDGGTASAPNRRYPVILEPANIVAGQANTVPYVYYLPPIDVQYEVQLVPGQPAAAGNPRVPGLQMNVPADAHLRNRDGSPVTRVSITPLSIDRTPTPLPPNVATNIVYTSQPGGALTDVAIPVVYPNLAGSDPGTRITLYAFDHNLVRWYIYGYGRVSADGRTIVPETDPNTGRPYGLRDFSWHFPDAAPDGNPHDCDDDECDGSCTSNTVDLSTGVKIERTVDLSFGGARGGLTLERIHTSDLPQSCDSCPFGRGTTHNFMMRLDGSFTAGGAGRYVMPGEARGRLFNYSRTDTDGALVFSTTATTGQLGDVIRKLTDGTYEYRESSGDLTRFNAAGQPTAMVDRNGNTTTLAYAGGRLSTVTDAVGRSLTFEYDFASRITRVTDSTGRIWRYTYEGTPGTAGNPGLTTVTDPLNHVTRYTYSVGGRLASVADKRGTLVKQIVYDDNGRVTKQTYADGSFELYAYMLSGRIVTGVTHTDTRGATVTKRFDARGYVVSSTDELGQTSRTERDITTSLPTATEGPCGCQESVKQYDARGNVVAETNRLGQSVKLEYEPVFNNITKMTDKLNRVTTYTYDAHGNLTSVTDPLQQTTRLAYDQYGQLISTTDPLGHTTRMEYDQYSHVSAAIDALNNRTTFENDALGRQTAVVDPLGRRSTKTYDALDRVLTATTPSGVETRFTYDANGNQLKQINQLAREWTAQYDAKNRLISQTDPLGRTLLYRYDAADHLIAKVSPSGRTTRYTYDARDMVDSITTPVGGVIRLTYNSRRKLTSVKDERGHTTTFTYDELYRPVATVDPLGRTSTVAYDVAGNAVESIDRLGRHRTTTYDELNRPARTTFADAVVTYHYDASSRLTGLDDTQGGNISWVYDDADRLLTETTANGTVTYTYNAAGQRTSTTAAGRASAVYGFDAGGRLSTVAQGAGTFTYAYDALSRQTSLQRPNGVTTTYTYDEINRPVRIQHTNAGGQALEDFRYTYALDGEIDAITSLASAQLLTTDKTIGTPDAANRITQFGASSQDFDAQGQITTQTDAQGTKSFQWDARGRLKQVTLPNGQTVSYDYDPIGRLASRTAGGATTNFVYDGIEIVLDRGSDGSAIDYLNGGETDGKLRQGSDLYFLQDHLGSVVALTDAGGSVVQRMQYEAFGEGPGSTLTRYGYTGRERDNLSGLLHYRARWYDPRQGRFISEDPIGMAGGLNQYVYTTNDPVNLTDPLGLQEQNPWQQPPDPNKDRKTYNCVGLACRTYENQPDVDKFKNEYLKDARKLKNCSEKCKKCEIKFWLWEYELSIEDENGNLLNVRGGNPHQDFHTVAGQSDCKTGADPTNVYSKNGPRPIHGPGTGGSFRPPDREVLLDSDDNPMPGVYKVRRKMVETCYCKKPPKAKK